MNSHLPIDAAIRNALVSYPNFPKPGIVFKDISPVFSNPELVKPNYKNLEDASRCGFRN
jgi:adenine/guanine phosphoribosyltransferase-like PRPP-binding protein